MIEVDEITELPRVEAAVRPGDGPGLRPNRVLAERLGVMHRVRHRLLVEREHQPGPPPGMSSDAKLIKAIFGEREIAPAGELVAVGARVVRRTSLIKHPQGEVWFQAADAGEVEVVTRDQRDLPAEYDERITVIVRWPGPLTAGDVLWSSDQRLGLVDAIIDDGEREPCLYGGTAASGMLVERRLPTAAQQVEARAIGPYSVVTGRPLGGQEVRDDQIEWLAANGGRAVASEWGGAKTSDERLRIRVYEELVKLEPVPDFWSRDRPATPGLAASVGAPPKGIFSFFEPPGPLTLDSVQLLAALARACGLGIELDGHALALSLRPPDDPATWSRGEVRVPDTFDFDTFTPVPGGLFCQRLFGPIDDYRCACGALDRLKNRGLVCDSCGVEVTRSAVRRERFAHVTLATPIIPVHLHPLTDALLDGGLGELLALADREGGTTLLDRLAGISVRERVMACEGTDPRRAILEAFARSHISPASLAWHVLPIAPPGVRPIVPMSRGRYSVADLNELYQAVILRNERLRSMLALGSSDAILDRERRALREAVDSVFVGGYPLQSLFGNLGGELAFPGPWRTDYSGAAILVLDDTVADDRCRMPLSLIGVVASPIVFGVIESLGHATSIQGAKRLVEKDAVVRRGATEMVMHDRVVMLANDDVSRSGAMAPAAVEVSDEPVVRVGRSIADRLGLTTGDRVVVHLPITDAGQHAAKVMMAGAAPASSVVEGGWIREVTEASNPVERLVELAIAGAVDPCEWPRAALLIGGHALDGPPPPPIELGPAPERPTRAGTLDTPIAELVLSVTTSIALDAAGVRTLRDLVQLTQADLLQLKRFGRKSLKEVIEALAELNLTLASTRAP